MYTFAIKGLLMWTTSECKGQFNVPAERKRNILPAVVEDTDFVKY